MVFAISFGAPTAIRVTRQSDVTVAFYDTRSFATDIEVNKHRIYHGGSKTTVTRREIVRTAIAHGN